MCGIAAFIGEIKTPILFKIVSLYQDSRGGDGAGVGYLNSTGEFEVIKGLPHPIIAEIFKDLNPILNEEIAYPDIGTLYELFGYVTSVEDIESNIIIAHTRRTTIGSHEIYNIHPFCFSGKKEILGCHNGTVTNYASIGKKYNYPEEALSSDSKVLLYSIALDKLEEVYQEIEGAATLVWTEKGEEALYVVATRNSARTGLDRSLYYLITPEGTFLSSEYSPLSTIKGLLTDPKNPKIILKGIYIFEPDILYKVTKTGIKKIKTLTKASPTKTTVSEVSNLVGQSIELLIKDTHSPYRNHLYYCKGAYWYNQELVTTQFTADEIPSLFYLFDKEGRAVKLIDGTYYYNIGNNNWQPLQDEEPVYELYFINGILISSKEKFLELARQTPQIQTLNAASLIGYSKYPIPATLKTREIISGYFYGDTARDKVQGIVIPIFSEKVYEFKGGFVCRITPITRKNISTRWKLEQFLHTKEYVNGISGALVF